MSPWGGEQAPPLSAYMAVPDLAARLRAVDAETAALGLRLVIERRGELPRGGGALVVRGYAGVDAVGRSTSAVRVATPRGVIMAAGPLGSADTERGRATELIPSLTPGAPPAPAGGGADAGVFASGTDLNGDGDPDVVLRNEAGALEIWAARAIGARRIDVELAAAPTFALDIDDDGRLELAGRAAIERDDPLAPDLLDVATFEDGRYTHRSAAARAFHAARAAPPPAPRATPAAPDAAAGAVPPPPDDRTRLRRAIERAWHARLSGEPAEAVLARLDREPAPPPLRAAFASHRAHVARAGARRGGDAAP